jgi:methylase of polypeptide subunit release factors
MTRDGDLEALADPARDQHFLVSPEKISQFLAAADIRPTDHVIEIGAGVGTIARHVPPCASLTVIELDGRLIDLLRANTADDVAVIHGDGIALLHQLCFDVLLSNLPWNVTTTQLFDELPNLSFRTAVIAVGANTPTDHLACCYDLTEITTITGTDFRPPQHGISRLIKLSPRQPREPAQAQGDASTPTEA